MEDKQIFEKMINEVLEDFDFEKVRAVMTLLDRKWYVASREISVVPTVEMLREKAKDLLEKVTRYHGDEQPHAIGSGGLLAWIVGDSLSLQYILTESEAFDPRP